jgi:hypothetical protein
MNIPEITSDIKKVEKVYSIINRLDFDTKEEKKEYIVKLCEKYGILYSDLILFTNMKEL